MNKFLQSISTGDKILLKRAESLATAASIEQQQLINFLKNEKVRLELKGADLTDLSPKQPILLGLDAKTGMLRYG